MLGFLPAQETPIIHFNSGLIRAVSSQWLGTSRTKLSPIV
jgi:hypothetical protein